MTFFATAMLIICVIGIFGFNKLRNMYAGVIGMGMLGNCNWICSTVFYVGGFDQDPGWREIYRFYSGDYTVYSGNCSKYDLYGTRNACTMHLRRTTDCAAFCSLSAGICSSVAFPSRCDFPYSDE